MSSQEAIENQRSLELGFTEMTRKSFPKDSISGVMSSKSGNGRMGSSIAATPNAFSGDDESSSKLSSPVVESNNCDLLRVDLKLGRFADHSDVQNIDSALATPILSSAESSMPAKKPRAADSSSQALFCKVHGCKKDLSSSKDYHKRHKVCEVHSKTSKVIVSGIEQRFCQQCSRFHLLAEFDDGKRSCRKRLACHNERRRKPRVGNHSGRAERLFQSYNGSRFQGTTLTTSSFNCPDMLPSSLMDLHKCESSEWRRQVKIEDGDGAELAEHGPQSVIPIRNGNLHLKSIFSSYGLEKQSPFHGSGLNTEKGSDFNENINSYPHDLSGSNSFSRCFFQNTSTGTENFTFFNSASTVEGLSDVSDSGLALSLLSSQSRNSSSHLSGTPMAHPLIIPGSHSHNSVNPVSEKFPSTISQALTSGVSNRLHSAGMISAEENYLGLRLISDDSDTVNFGIANGVFQGPEFLNTEDCFSRGNGPTIDLLQLPSQLQRVEHQSHSMQ